MGLIKRIKELKKKNKTLEIKITKAMKCITNNTLNLNTNLKQTLGLQERMNNLIEINTNLAQAISKQN